MKKTYEYEIVKSRVGTGGGRMLYLLRHEFGTTISEKWVGINQLRRYCEEGRIVGKVPDIIRDRLNYARPVKKVRKDKGKSRKKVKLVPIINPPKIRDTSGWEKQKVEPINQDIEPNQWYRSYMENGELKTEIVEDKKMYYIWDKF